MSDELCCIAAGHLAGYSMPGSLMKGRIKDGGIDSATTQPFDYLEITRGSG